MEPLSTSIEVSKTDENFQLNIQISFYPGADAQNDF